MNCVWPNMQNRYPLIEESLSLFCDNDIDIKNCIEPRRDEIISLLENFLSEIEKFNPALKLVGTNDRRDLILKHILDSLSPLKIFIKKCGCRNSVRQYTIADIGSGAGFPGIPLAIVLPDTHVTLIERMGRRTGFLRNTLTVLGLKNVSVEEAEMEKVKTGRFDLVTCRAFKPLEPKIFKKLFRLCGEGGVLAAYKGRYDKTLAEITALEQALPELKDRWEIIPCPVPMLDEERHLLLIYSMRNEK